MTLKALLSKEDHARLPAALQSEYTARDDGSFMLDVEPVEEKVGDKLVRYALEDVQGLRAGLSSERTRAAVLKDQLEALKDIDPAKARAALRQVEEMKNWSPEEKVQAQIDAVKKALGDKHAGEIATVQKKADAYKKQIETVLVDQAIQAELIAGGANDQGVKLLPAQLKSRVRAEENSAGVIVTTIVDEQGNPQLTNRVGSTEGMRLGELVETYKKSFPGMFKGSGATGGGTPGKGSGGQGGSSTQLDSTMKPAELLRAARAQTSSQ